MASWLFNVRLLAVACLLSVVFLPGCGDIGSLGGIIVSPTTITIGINQHQFFSALGRSSGGFLIATTPVWSADAALGTINSLSGYFTAGTVETTGSVEATDGSLSGAALVTITKKGWLQGNVTDTNGGIANGIRVFLNEQPTYGDETDAKGNYSISGIPAGTYEAVINPSSNIYPDGATQEVTIGEGKTVTWSPVLNTPTTSLTTTTGVI
jgi:hypothetical protein